MNNNSGSASHSATEKGEIIVQECDKDEEMKFKREESMDTNVSEASTLDLEEASDGEKLNSGAKRKHYVPPLFISNLPEHYSLQQIGEYLEKLCGPCDVSISKEDCNGRIIEAKFRNTSQRANAKKILSFQSINELRVKAESPEREQDTESENEGPWAKRKKESENTPWGVDMDVWRVDPKGFYGVKPQYLSSLGINKPLQNWVLVQNFRCGREELKDVMDLAGDVVACCVQNHSTPSRYARVMYRHPLEALQAVSMLHGQMLYGRPLTVKMLKVNGVVLPKGLNNVGPGLAKYGRPLRDVVRHYEWYIKGEENELNRNLFRTPQEQYSNEDDVYSENDDNERKAREALETLVSLVAKGVKVQDLLLELRLIKDENKHALDQLVKELDTDDAEYNHDGENPPPPGTIRAPSAPRDENEHVRSSSVTPKSTASPDCSKTSNETSRNASPSQNMHQISTIPSNRPSDSRWPKPAQIRPVAPAFAPSHPTGLGPRYMRPGPSGSIPGPVGPRQTLISPSGSMPMPPGPISRLMMMPIQRPMQGPRSNLPVPISGPVINTGPNGGMAISGRPVSGPAGPLSGPMPGPNFSMPGPNTHPPFGPSVHPTSGPEATLLFSNLPPSTTFALLSDKLSQVGQLISIQFGQPGCVMVKYAHRTQAERCIQQFDKSRLDGHLIAVKFI